MADDGQGFVCKWEDFSLNASTILKEIQARSDYCDAKLICSDSNGQALTGHRVILASFSTVFEDMFDQLGGTQFVTNSSIYLRGINAEDLSSILDFIYQGEVTVPEERMSTFLSAAEDLRIVGIYQQSGPEEPRPQKKESKKERYENMNQDMNGDGKSFNKYSQALKKEFQQSLKRGASRSDGVILEEMNGNDFDPSNSDFPMIPNIKSDPDFRGLDAVIKNEVILEALDDNGMANGFELDLNSAGADRMNGMDFDASLTPDGATSLGGGLDEDYSNPPEPAMNEEPKQSLAKCKLCGKIGRKDKIKKHMKDVHFPKPKDALGNTAPDPKEIPSNFSRDNIEFFDHPAHWNPQWNKMIMSQDTLPHKWMIKHGKTWLEYLPNEEDISQSRMRCRICFQYGNDHEYGRQRQEKQKGLNTFSPLLLEEGDLKANSELNRKMLQHHVNSDFHRYTVDHCSHKRKALRDGTLGSSMNAY